MVYRYVTRSRGVVIFSVSLIAFGAFGAFLLILSILLLTLKDTVPGFSDAVPQVMVQQPLFWISTVLNLFIFVSWVVSGVGTLHLKDWSRHFLRIVMAIHVINMIVNICLNIFLAEESISTVSIGFLLGGIVISFSYYLGVIYFFSHPKVVRQFKFKSRDY